MTSDTLAEDFGLDKEIDGTVEIDVTDDEWSLDNRDRLRQQADSYTSEPQSTGPREQLAEAIGDTSNPGYVAAVEALDVADGLHESPNAAVDEIDRRFPDDLRKRQLARDVSELMENELGYEYEEDPARGVATGVHAASMDRIAAGETNSDEVARQAAAIVSVEEDLEVDFGDDVDAWDRARVMAHDRIIDGEDADQAYWNTKDHIEDLHDDGKW